MKRSPCHLNYRKILEHLKLERHVTVKYSIKVRTKTKSVTCNFDFPVKLDTLLNRYFPLHVGFILIKILTLFYYWKAFPRTRLDYFGSKPVHISADTNNHAFVLCTLNGSKMFRWRWTWNFNRWRFFVRFVEICENIRSSSIIISRGNSKKKFGVNCCYIKIRSTNSYRWFKMQMP